MAVSITYDGFDLQNSNIMVDSIDHASIPTKTAQLYTLSHASGSVIPFVDYPSKTITVTGTVVGTSILDLDLRLDTFRSWFIGSGKNLDIGYVNSIRRYVATVNSLSIQRPGNLNYATFSIEFICTNPFGSDITPTTALNASGRTNAFYSDAFTFTGSAPSQRSVITITLTGLTGGTGANVNFGNASTGQTITVTRTWVAGDVLQIDCVNNAVSVNGIAVDFTGAFPVFAPGSQTMTYGDSLTTRTFSVNVIYYALWL